VQQLQVDDRRCVAAHGRSEGVRADRQRLRRDR
jgi:hypothetical protein